MTHYIRRSRDEAAGRETVEQQQAQLVPPAEPTSPPRRRKRRVFLWVFLAIQVLFIVWIVAGASSASSSGTSVDCTGLSAADCQSLKDAAAAGTAVGTGLGIAAVVITWCVVDFLVGFGYTVYRLARRPS
jgi:hypothetical protein